MGLDTLRHKSIDTDIRNVTDYLFFKSLGMHGMPQDLHYIYASYEPNVMQRLRPWEYVVLTQKGSLGVGTFPDIPWHKREKEHMLELLGITVEFGDEITYSTNRGSFNTVGDEEHSRIIERRIEEGLAMGVRARAMELFISVQNFINSISIKHDSIVHAPRSAY